MKILLLQDEIYLPSLGGGTKANRYLLQGLAKSGHTCLAITRALTRSPDGPNTRDQWNAEMDARGIAVEASHADVMAYQHAGVRVHAGLWSDEAQARAHVRRELDDFRPDWVIVADDKRRFMLESALCGGADRVILLVQTIVQLPFGPLAVESDVRQAERMGQARAIVVISRYLQRYLRDHGQLDGHLLRLPVYGEPPFPNLSSFDSGFITMVNPCPLKGVGIFLALAREFPDLPFAAVPTWGADDSVLSELRALPNVQLLPPNDDIEEILRQTRLLVVPSLWPETFGYVVPEAMLRGIPVLASNVGGLPEAKLGVDYVLPVTPLQPNREMKSPEQDLRPWLRALRELVSDADAYARCAHASRTAALAFVRQARPAAFEQLLLSLEAQHTSG